MPITKGKDGVQKMKKLWKSVAVGAITCCALVSTASVAQADLHFDEVGFSLDNPPRTHEVKEFDFSCFCEKTVQVPDVNSDGTFVDPEFSRQAGSHPDFSAYFKLDSDPATGPKEAARDIEVDLPRGMVGNPTAFPTCSTALLTSPGHGGAECPVDSQLGIAEIQARASGGPIPVFVGIFNVEHGSDVPALFGFNYGGVVGLISARVRPGDYGISSGSISIPQGEALESVRIRLWGVPWDPSHDFSRQGTGGSVPANNFNTPSSVRNPVNRPPVAFLTAPTSCTGQPLSFTARGDSWEHPGAFDTVTATADEDGTPFTMEDCERVPFTPKASAQQLSRSADSPTGLDVKVEVPQPNEPNAFTQAHVRKVRMVLPQGISIAPGSAAGLGACSPAQIGLGNNNAPACPSSSKLGTVTIETPLLNESLSGDIVLATPYDNPSGSLIALYITAKGPGFYLKLPGKVDLDPVTGQVTATFDENPQLPFSKLSVSFPGGPQASLATPPTCGTYGASTELTSWASPTPLSLPSPMTIDQGCTPGPNAPSFTAGTNKPLAGKYAPFSFSAARNDRTPYLSRIETTLPPGLLANIGSVTRCGEAAANAGTCPPASQIGSTSTLAGPGALPLAVKGNVYLTGPYKGAPFGMSIAVPTAGQAGPFDLGVVVVRAGIYIDPTTTSVTVKSDPLPTIIKGIPLRLRQVNLEINRLEFTLNPTNCAPKSIVGNFDALGAPTSHQTLPFQVAACGELGFGPNLQLSLSGSTKRAGNPALSATLKAPKGEANIAKTTVLLPKTQFVDNRHINNPCTRVQFNANACPPSSILGHAVAYSPLLDQPLKGPVYFRSNGGERELPDLVVDLNGQIHVTLVGFIDSVPIKGTESARIRTRFLSIPDAPVSKFELKLFGGKKGLIQNSTNICKDLGKAKVQMAGQNGKPNDFDQKIGTSCGGGGKAKKSRNAAKH